MRNILIITWLILFTAMGWVCTAQGMAKGVETECLDFEEAIVSGILHRDYKEVIHRLGEYEEFLLTLYPAPVIDKGMFYDAARHIAFSLPFPGWQCTPYEDVDILKSLQIGGFEVILILKGKAQGEALAFMSLNSARLSQRTGINAPEDDIELYASLLTRTLTAQFGTVKNRKWEKIGEHEILFLDFNVLWSNVALTVAMFSQNGKCYVFLMSSPKENVKQNREHLYAILSGLDLQYGYKSAIPKIKAVRARFPDEKSIQELLKRVRQLALSGELEAAREDLNRVWSLVVSFLPGPTSNGLTASYSLYGITLSNPDPKRWSLSVDGQNGMGIFLLQEKDNLANNGIVLAVVDLALVYGPQMTKCMNTEELQQALLASAGLGGLLAVGGTVESERFCSFKGFTAYEGIAQVGPFVKLKALTVLRSNQLILISCIADSQNFDRVVNEYERILNQYLEFEKT